MSRVYDPRFDVPITGTGFYAEYFALTGNVKNLSQIDFDAPADAVGTVGALNYATTNNAFWNGGPQDWFAARYTSELQIDTAGSYTFYLNSDDGSALSIDGERIINNDGRHGATQRQVTIELSAGTHDIDVQYFEAFGSQTLQLLWNGPDTGGRRVQLGNDDLTYANVMSGTDDVGAPAPAPESTPAQGLKVEYFVQDSPIRTLSDIDFDAAPDFTSVIASSSLGSRNNDAFWAGGPNDQVAVRITGVVDIQEAGRYRFDLTSDDGSTLLIDGRPVIGNDGLHAQRTEQVSLDLTAGAHTIEIQYFEAFGSQILELLWQGPDTGGQTVPMSGDTLRYVFEATSSDSSDAPVATVPDQVESPVVTVPDQGNAAGTMTGLRADFFAVNDSPRSLDDIAFGATPSHTQTIAAVDFASSNDPFWQGGPTDRFAARITGDLNVENAGSYTIYLTSDDGSALYVDGMRVIGNDGLHARATVPVTLDLDAGAHDIEVRYFESGGIQTLQLEWQGPDSNGARVTIDGDSLSHDPESAVPSADMDAGVVTGSATNDQIDQGDVSVVEPVEEVAPPTVPADQPDMPMDHGEMAPIQQPVTSAEIEAFVAAVLSQPDSHAHGDNAAMSTEHMQLLNLVPRSDATHVAVSDGDWFDPNTWYEGRIPDAGARVLIPEGVSVNYDGESDASLFTVRVDGELGFAHNVDTRMVVDTFVVSASGRLEIGTAANPIDANVNVDIVIANNGDIDVSWDPTLLSRGIISHGDVEIHGAEKDPFLKVSDAPMSGDTSLRLSEVPDGWQVGDTIVVTGTHKTGWTGTREGHIESQDEEVTITAINGDQISFDRALQYDHDTPRADLFAYIANTSRNITVRSEDGDATEVYHRGHVMFMHNDDVDVRYAAFDDLGRTDKSVPAFDVGSLSNVEADSNIKSRYPFHFHKTGTTDQEEPAMAVGNAVNGSPGWGFVHHSSNANMTDNVSFDVFGAGFAAESGDETGVWIGNMAIKSEGIGFGAWSAKQGPDVARMDVGRTGDGFFFAGRLVEAAENVAVNTTNGFVWMHRNAGADPLSANLDHPEIAYGADTIPVNRGPIQGFRDNEAYGTHTGVMVIKANAVQETHEVRSVFDGFLNWETVEGADISYTAHYTLLDFDLISASNLSGAFENTGMHFGTNTYDMVMNGLKMEGFDTGVDFDQVFHFSVADEDIGHVVIDMETINVGADFIGFDSNKHQLLTSDDLDPGRLSFTISDDLVIGKGDNLNLDGIKTDSIGTIDRASGQESLQLEFYKQIIQFIANEGYYKTTDGRNVLLIEDFIADRATGELLKMTHVVTLDMTDAEIGHDYMINSVGGAKFNGIVDLGGSAALARNDSATTSVNESVMIDVLANDTDPDGDVLRVDGFMDAQHGDVYVQENGQLLYQPNVGYTGTDSFDYWAADDAGHFTQATVTIEVWE
jgi:hypothetical protein